MNYYIDFKALDELLKIKEKQILIMQIKVSILKTMIRPNKLLKKQQFRIMQWELLLVIEETDIL